MKKWTLLVCLLFASCSKSPNTFTPSPRATATVADVISDAARWVAVSQDRGWSFVAPTGSMEPFINEHSLLLFVRYNGQPLSPGAVVIYNRGDAARVVHVASVVREDSVYMSGFANRSSDGWFKKSSIEGIVVGQLYLP